MDSEANCTSLTFGQLAFILCECTARYLHFSFIQNNMKCGIYGIFLTIILRFSMLLCHVIKPIILCKELATWNLTTKCPSVCQLRTERVFGRLCIRQYLCTLVAGSTYNHMRPMHGSSCKWESAIIAPIYKKGSPHLSSNYRTVSLNCICSKVIKHIMGNLIGFNRLYWMARHQVQYWWPLEPHKDLSLGHSFLST